MKAVIADDDEDIRALVRIAAGKAGIEVVADVADGTDAWAAIESLRPDLAVLDHAMPGMTGIEVCRRTRQHASLDDVRLVLVTAAADGAARERGLAAGVDEYVTKPFTLRELTRIMSEQRAVR